MERTRSDEGKSNCVAERKKSISITSQRFELESLAEHNALVSSKSKCVHAVFDSLSVRS